MKLNEDLLTRLMGDVEKHFGGYLKRILVASTDYGTFGLPLLDALHDDLPRTTCGNCGICCNSVSIFSIEYHRIIRDLMSRLPPDRIRALILRGLRLDQRLAEVSPGGPPSGGQEHISPIVGVVSAGTGSSWPGGQNPASGSPVDPENRLRCSFRDEDTKVCLVHPVRPFACRFYGLLKADGTRECDQVKELEPAPPLTEERVEELSMKLMDISESFVLAEGKAPVAFFPFEFWLFRFALGPEKALQIYREILVPSSTPLTRFYREFCG